MSEVHHDPAFTSPPDVPLHTADDSRPKPVVPAAVIRLDAEQTAGIRAASDKYQLVGPVGQSICVRGQDNPSGSANVAFTPEQWEEAIRANGTVEIQDCSSATVGYLVLNPHINLFYTTQAIDTLVKRAREAKPGRTLGEILGDALARAGA